MKPRPLAALLAAVVVTGACAGAATAGPATARVLFAGDVMLGRGVAPAAAAGDGVFDEVRSVVAGADLAAANLESPLTRREHIADNPFALEADPATASLLAGAGFDLMSLANNHAGDAGPGGVTDTLTALGSAGMEGIGAGTDAAAAEAAVLREVHGIRVAFLAFDLSGAGRSATAHAAGVAPYERAASRRSVAAAAESSDVVAVSLHGGIEYLASDAVLEAAAADLVAAGADVVWGHGAHVVHPVATRPGVEGRTAVVATGLGNLLFDQGLEATEHGAVLEVLVSTAGVLAYRTGRTDHSDLRVRFDGWDVPPGDAVLLHDGWWTPLHLPAGPDPAPVAVTGFAAGDVVAAASGDLTGDGDPDLVVSFRRPYVENPVNALFPGLIDAAGRSAHLGVFQPGTLEQVWVGGTLLRPVSRVAVCDGSLALAFDALDDPAVAVTGAWQWAGFGFAAAPDLPGPGTPGCRDVDGDGATEPVITGRNPS
jgi:poly-gamma-glutamate capsule biosynthesis protein CapA/YwtB (metallophosphatase superfamily)